MRDENSLRDEEKRHVTSDNGAGKTLLNWLKPSNEPAQDDSDVAGNSLDRRSYMRLAGSAAVATVVGGAASTTAVAGPDNESGETLDVTADPYNANGDGTSDDRAAIQNAIDDAESGDTVLIPEGVYYVGSPYLELQDLPDGVTLRGEGELDSELLMGPASQASFLVDIHPGSGHEGLEIRNLVLDGNRDNQPLNGRNTDPIHQIRHRDATSSDAEIDTLIKNVHLANGVHTALRLESGGVTVENCEISNHYMQPVGITTEGRTQPLPAIEIRECWIHDFGDSEPNSWVGIDSSDGYSIVEDTVIGPGSGRGFKCSVGHNEHEYRRVRVTGCEGGGVVSTNPSSGYMQLEDIVIDDCGAASWGTCQLTGIDFELVDGSQLVITGNNHTNPGLYVTEGGRLDASNAEVYVSHDAGPGLSANSTANIGYYGHYDNDGGALGATSGLDLGEQEQTDVTDIDGVPTADEVGAWSNDEDANESEDADNDAAGDDAADDESAADGDDESAADSEEDSTEDPLEGIEPTWPDIDPDDY